MNVADLPAGTATLRNALSHLPFQDRNFLNIDWLPAGRCQVTWALFEKKWRSSLQNDSALPVYEEWSLMSRWQQIAGKSRIKHIF